MGWEPGAGEGGDDTIYHLFIYGGAVSGSEETPEVADN